MKSFVVMAVLVAMAMAMASSVHGECTNDLSPYKPCMIAVVGLSPPLPSSACCDTMKGADLHCLCSAVASANIPELNHQAALMLPKRCGVLAPGQTTCGPNTLPFARKLMDLH